MDPGGTRSGISWDLSLVRVWVSMGTNCPWSCWELPWELSEWSEILVHAWESKGDKLLAASFLKKIIEELPHIDGAFKFSSLLSLALLLGLA